AGTAPARHRPPAFRADCDRELRRGRRRVHQSGDRRGAPRGGGAVRRRGALMIGIRSVTSILVLLVIPIGLARQADEGRAPRTTAEFDALFTQVSNWGRWGADDQLGSVNLVTAAKRKQAVALVKSGVSVSLAHNPLTERAEDNNNPFEHTMLRGNNL